MVRERLWESGLQDPLPLPREPLAERSAWRTAGLSREGHPSTKAPELAPTSPTLHCNPATRSVSLSYFFCSVAYMLLHMPVIFLTNYFAMVVCFSIHLLVNTWVLFFFFFQIVTTKMLTCLCLEIYQIDATERNE